MRRPFKDIRVFGPLIDYSSNSDLNEKLYTQQLSNSGAEEISTSYIGDTLVIDFLTIGDKPENEFSSSIEISEDGVNSCLLRLPHLIGGVSEWDKLSDDIAIVVDRETNIDAFEGLLKTERERAGIFTNDGVIIRPNDGFANPGRKVFTPHIQFTATDMSGDSPTVPASFHEITDVIEGLNKMWDERYSSLQTVKSENIR